MKQPFLFFCKFLLTSILKNVKLLNCIIMEKYRLELSEYVEISKKFRRFIVQNREILSIIKETE